MRGTPAWGCSGENCYVQGVLQPWVFVRWRVWRRSHFLSWDHWSFSRCLWSSLILIHPGQGEWDDWWYLPGFSLLWSLYYPSVMFAVCSSGFHLTIYIVTFHLAGLQSDLFFFLRWYLPCLCWNMALMLSWVHLLKYGVTVLLHWHFPFTDFGPSS